jgi:hypothetical protein
VDNAVEKDLKAFAHREALSRRVGMVKKASKSIQRPATKAFP